MRASELSMSTEKVVIVAVDNSNVRRHCHYPTPAVCCLRLNEQHCCLLFAGPLCVLRLMRLVRRLAHAGVLEGGGLCEGPLSRHGYAPTLHPRSAGKPAPSTAMTACAPGPG